jgi:hypothetical protein
MPAVEGQADMAATGQTGGGQISSEIESRQPAPLSPTDFFLLGAYFRRYPFGVFAASELKIKKTSLYRVLTQLTRRASCWRS